MSKTDAVVQLARQKHEVTRRRVLETLSRWPEGQPVTFAAVSHRAGVSKTFLYDPRQTDLAEQIRQRRSLPVRPTPPPARHDLGKSEAAKDAQIARLQERVRHQERELARLRDENAQLYGRLAEHR